MLLSAPLTLRISSSESSFSVNSKIFIFLADTELNNIKDISEIVIQKKNLRKERIDYLLSKFELENVKNIKAKFLSGGQKKKLVISLSLLSNPKVLLLDEPLAALDPLVVQDIQKYILKLQSYVVLY